MAFGDYQNEIYFQGLAGVVPSLPMVFAELEAKAEKALPPSVWSYVAGGALSAPIVRSSTGGV
jgi:lactate 2-monooxygenase